VGRERHKFPRSHGRGVQPTFIFKSHFADPCQRLAVVRLP
jgi:hypothetical protein